MLPLLRPHLSLQILHGLFLPLMVLTVSSCPPMVQEHFPGSIPYLPGEDVPEEHPFDFDEDPEADHLRPLHSLEWISNYRIERAIAHFGPHKSAGPDGFKPLVLQKLPLKAISYLRIHSMCSLLIHT